MLRLWYDVTNASGKGAFREKKTIRKEGTRDIVTGCIDILCYITIDEAKNTASRWIDRRIDRVGCVDIMCYITISAAENPYC